MVNIQDGKCFHMNMVMYEHSIGNGGEVTKKALKSRYLYASEKYRATSMVWNGQR